MKLHLTIEFDAGTNADVAADAALGGPPAPASPGAKRGAPDAGRDAWADRMVKLFRDVIAAPAPVPRRPPPPRAVTDEAIEFIIAAHAVAEREGAVR